MTGKLSGGGHVTVQLDPAAILEGEIIRVTRELKAAEKAGKPRKAKKMKEMLERLYNYLEG